MKKKYLYSILFICIFINILLITIVIIPSYQKYKEKKEYEELLKNTPIIVELKDNLTVPFFSDAKVSDFIKEINGEIVNDYNIKTNRVGEQNIKFEYINEDNIKIPYSYDIIVEDQTPPDIWLNSTYTITTDYNGNLLEDIVCADNYDDNPVCEIIGEYDTTKEGKYELTFIATDASQNTTTKEFTLNVKKPSTANNNSYSSSYTDFQDVIANYKNENTQIGIDVSSWQGDIDFNSLKEAGVEFVFIRVGSTKGINGEYFVDKKFQQNIEGFNNVGIPVGIYFYSYSNSKESAIKDANWVIEQIKDYEIDLPVVYDWESWSFYNEFNLSFYSLTNNAKAFLDTVKKSGYEGTLYSSKNYLEKVWYDTGYDVWLAHYTKQTSYEGDYKYWQLCSNGKVNGINGYVDINIMYN